MKLLLHACCGPCSLEPVRLLLEQGHKLAIFFANSNIQPKREYDQRLEVLLQWAEDEDLEVIEGVYDEAAWQASAGAVERSGGLREQRCRTCYRMRLEEAAIYAASHGFEALSTTLAVSPYQYSEACHEELEAACARHGLACVWEDFRPYYPAATIRSRQLGMYRQNYCGCAHSRAEAEAERAMRAQEKAEKAKEREAELERARAEKVQRQAEYERKKQMRRAARQAAKDAVEDGWRG